MGITYGEAAACVCAHASGGALTRAQLVAALLHSLSIKSSVIAWMMTGNAAAAPPEASSGDQIPAEARTHHDARSAAEKFAELHTTEQPRISVVDALVCMRRAGIIRDEERHSPLSHTHVHARDDTYATSGSSLDTNVRTYNSTTLSSSSPTIDDTQRVVEAQSPAAAAIRMCVHTLTHMITDLRTHGLGKNHGAAAEIPDHVWHSASAAHASHSGDRQGETAHVHAHTHTHTHTHAHSLQYRVSEEASSRHHAATPGATTEAHPGAPVPSSAPGVLPAASALRVATHTFTPGGPGEMHVHAGELLLALQGAECVCAGECECSMRGWTRVYAYDGDGRVGHVPASFLRAADDDTCRAYEHELATAAARLATMSDVTTTRTAADNNANPPAQGHAGTDFPSHGLRSESVALMSSRSAMRHVPPPSVSVNSDSTSFSHRVLVGRDRASSVPRRTVTLTQSPRPAYLPPVATPISALRESGPVGSVLGLGGVAFATKALGDPLARDSFSASSRANTAVTTVYTSGTTSSYLAPQFVSPRDAFVAVRNSACRMAPFARSASVPKRFT